LISRTTKRFRDALEALPEEIQEQARAAYALFEEDPAHPGLRFTRVHTKAEVYSVRVSGGYRALGVRDTEAADTIVWFWIGSHVDYERLLKRL
jgi:hypothetical protein